MMQIESLFPANLRALAKYWPLYTSAERFGSAAILRQYVGIESELVLPISISHGVDMNHCATAMDVDGVEPLHWSYNETIHVRAQAVKASVRLPHPWVILDRMVPRRRPRRKALVIGPPPGQTNDERLLELLRREGYSEFDVLVKHRGGTDRSREFWEASGAGVTTAGVQDNAFYFRLFDILQDYEEIVGCTLSSALFYAAALDKTCKVLKTYRYSAYETADYLNAANFSSAIARDFVRLMNNGRPREASELALAVLGIEFLQSPADLALTLRQATESIRHPLHHAGHTSWFGQKFAETLALRTGRGGLIRMGTQGILRQKLRNRVCIMSINEIDVWLHGLNDNNFQLQSVPYVKRVTEPGWAADLPQSSRRPDSR